jgi:hypothetical protein
MFKQLRRRESQASKISPRHHGWPVVNDRQRRKILAGRRDRLYVRK